MPHCERMSLLTGVFALAVTTAATFLFVKLVPFADWPFWATSPLAAVVQHLAGPGWLRVVMGLALAAAAALLLLPAVHGALR